MTPQENKVIQANKFKVLTYLGKPVDENLLSNGIYHTQKPILHDYSETIGMIIDRGKKLLDCQGRCFVPDSYFDNLEKCELTDFILTALDTEPKVNQELDNLLLSVCQLIMGWNATENEWSEWDQKVYNEVVAMRLKMNPQLAKELNDAANSEPPKFISEMSKVTPEQRQERYMMKEQSQPVPDKTKEQILVNLFNSTPVKPPGRKFKNPFGFLISGEMALQAIRLKD